MSSILGKNFIFLKRMKRDFSEFSENFSAPRATSFQNI